ncbi:HNH endonuclease [Jeotgalibaca porci]|uniref:HNH endonuclease n=1 Tax=Jeotgalibaca porci TaxID=1868793 RepID=UPI00359F4B28
MVRIDKQAGGHRATYEKNKKVIYKTQNTCGICGHLVDFTLKSPHPMSASIDHIVPVSKNGHPSDMSNLQLAHRACNRQKSDKIFKDVDQKPQVLGNRNLPQTIDWTAYKSGQVIQQKTIIKIKRKKKHGG